MIRLDKLLHDCGYGSRKEVKALIRKQRVTINDVIVKNDDIKVDETKDIVKVDGDVGPITFAALRQLDSYIETIAKEVIEGKWGDGEDRLNRLTAAGYDYKAVQQCVNELLK